MSAEPGFTSPQASEAGLRDDGLEEGGGELAQQAPRSGAGQAAVAQRGESSSSSTRGSSSGMASR